MLKPFEIPGRVNFFTGTGGLTKLELRHGRATASLFLQGGHIDSYQPHPGHEVLWLSSQSNFKAGAAIRGGMPICWPWFGAYVGAEERPQHGFARTSQFAVTAAAATDENTRVVLRLADKAPFPEWRGDIVFESEIRLSDELWVEVRTTNKGDAPIEIGTALHTYFAVASAADVSIPELQGLRYKDKTLDFGEREQTAAFRVVGEIDRVFLDPLPVVQLQQRGAEGVIGIQNWGNSNLVIWNPGRQKAAAMADFDDEGYRSMVCIEPANALDNRIKLEPGKQHRLGQSIAVRLT